MGLDMFLYGVKSNKDGKEGIWEEVCYWRKANHIHKWFSNRFIKDQDSYGYYIVSEADLQSLLLHLKFLKKIKDEDKDFKLVETNLLKEERKKGYYEGDANYIAEAIFPPDNFGCCFGWGFIDDWYWEDIDDTIEKLTEVLKGNYDCFFYNASW